MYRDFFSNTFKFTQDFKYFYAAFIHYSVVVFCHSSVFSRHFLFNSSKVVSVQFSITINQQLSVVNFMCQPSFVSHQSSAVGRQPSLVFHQLSAISKPIKFTISVSLHPTVIDSCQFSVVSRH